jgi:predicted ABC-type sugar transport system permease subunit
VAHRGEAPPCSRVPQHQRDLDLRGHHDRVLDPDPSDLPQLSGLCGILIGVVCAFLIVQVRIDSFIATIGVSSLLAAFITAISGGEQILGMPDGFSNFGVNNIGGVTYSFIPLIVVSFIVWYVLERTSSGRRVYATGGNIEAARLSGVKTSVRSPRVDSSLPSPVPC